MEVAARSIEGKAVPDGDAMAVTDSTSKAEERDNIRYGRTLYCRVIPHDLRQGTAMVGIRTRDHGSNHHGHCLLANQFYIAGGNGTILN
jgi:hypothetical protein